MLVYYTGMLACLDVDYRGDEALAACIVFSAWNAEKPESVYTTRVHPVQPYIPGEFYKRELPCLLKVLGMVAEPLSTVIVDSHVWTGLGKPGLGLKLYEHIKQGTVVGVAKTLFHGCQATPVLRGGSTTPLYVDEVGERVEAADRVLEMHGPYRLPTLLKMVDRLCRDS